MDFQDGFNRIYGENEFGKTTIMSFIYLMFYGKTDGERSNDIQKSIRKKYTPWNKEPMSGRMEFEAGGVRYSLHKLFGRTITTDEVQLIALDTGVEIPLAREEEIGQRFFGMDAAGFEKSVFINTIGSFAGKDTSDDIAIRLSNLMEAGDESISGTEVLDRITQAKEALISKNKKRGSLIALREELQEMKEYRKEAASKAQTYLEQETKIRAMSQDMDVKKQRLSRLQLQERNLQELSDLPRLSRLQETLQSYNAQIQEYRADQEGGLIDRALAIQKELETQKRQLDLATEKMDDSVILMEEDEYAQFKKSRDERDKAKGLKEYMEHVLLPEQVRLQAAKDAQSTVQGAPPAKRKELLFLILLALALIIAAVTLVTSFYIGTVAAGVATIFFALLYIMKLQSNGKIYEQAFAVYNNEALKLATEVQTAKTEFLRCKQILEEKAGVSIPDVDQFYHKVCETYHEAEHQVLELTEELGCEEIQMEARYMESLSVLELRKTIRSLEKEVRETEDSLNALFHTQSSQESEAAFTMLMQKKEAAGKAMTEKHAALSAMAMTEDVLMQRVKELEQKRWNLSVEEENSAAIREEMQALSEELEQLSAGMLELGRAMDPNTVDLEMLDARILALTEEAEDRERYYKVLEGTERYMKQAVETASSTFGPALNSAAADIFSGLTGGKYPTLLVDREYKISVKGDAGAYRDWKYLSNGTIDQAYLSLRLAMTSLLTKDGESLPLLLDDIFIQYDDERKKQAFSYLEEYAKNSQVIYFTCHTT